MQRYLDFRSDTVTQPTMEMRLAMMNAVVGDDTLGDDPTVRRIEEMSATLLGKEASMFTLSGTMANQIAIMTMTRLGDEIIVGDETHIYNLEVGGLAALSGVQAKPLSARRGKFDIAELEAAIRMPGIQAPISRVICLENTYNLNRGIPLGKDYINEVSRLAKSRGVSVYLDGARIFNAAATLKQSAEELCEGADSVMFCLTKGLCAPMGAMLAGTAEFIERARWIRQRLGGGMRQAGCVAAAGIVALEKMASRLSEDHENAQHLKGLLQEFDPQIVDEESCRTNIVRLILEHRGVKAAELVDEMQKRGVKIKPVGTYACRMIIHNDISRKDVEETVEKMKDYLKVKA